MIDKVVNSAPDFDIDAAALPFVEAFEGSTFVIHCADDLLSDAALLDDFGKSVALLQRFGIKPVVVHGDGRLTDRLLHEAGVEVSYYQGVRVSTVAVMGAVETALADLNRNIVEVINRHGGRAAAPAANVPPIRARKRVSCWEDGIDERVDLGQVGEVERIEAGALILQQAGNVVPVVMPIGVESDGQRYSMDADAVAGSIAAALGAEKLIFLSNLPGVIDRNGRLLSGLTVGEMSSLFDQGLLPNHLLVKIEFVLAAIRQGVRGAHVVDGRVPGAVLLELLSSEGIGTFIRSEAGPHFFRDSLRYLHAEISADFDGQRVTFDAGSAAGST